MSEAGDVLKGDSLTERDIEHYRSKTEAGRAKEARQALERAGNPIEEKVARDARRALENPPLVPKTIK